jgi:hypothetical protein
VAAPDAVVARLTADGDLDAPTAKELPWRGSASTQSVPDILVL